MRAVLFDSCTVPYYRGCSVNMMQILMILHNVHQHIMEHPVQMCRYRGRIDAMNIEYDALKFSQAEEQLAKQADMQSWNYVSILFSVLLMSTCLFFFLYGVDLMELKLYPIHLPLLYTINPLLTIQKW